MEYLLIIVVLIGGIWIFFKLRPTKPLYREDIEPNEGDITLSEAKKILKQHLKENPEQPTSYRKDNTKAEVNEYIRDDLEEFTESIKAEKEDLLEEMQGFEEDLEDADEDDKEELKKVIAENKETLKTKDTSSYLLWELNRLRGIDSKTNSELRNRKYTKK